jgi:hypothetical protein
MKLVNSGGVNSKLIVDRNEQVHSPSMLHISNMPNTVQSDKQIEVQHMLYSSN